MSSLADDLRQLASEKSSPKRVELLRRLTDVYLEQPEQSLSAQQYLFNEVVSKLIDKIAPTDRAPASEQLSRCREIPGDVARLLALDHDVAVAGPMLRDYRGLAESVLIEAARSGSQSHLHAIASRPTVTPPVTDVVVERGDAHTIRTLATNQGAQFSSVGMGKLIGLAKQDIVLQEAIVERADLPLDAVGNLLSMINEELASRLRQRMTTVDAATVARHVADWVKDREQNVALTDGYITGIRQGHLNLNDVVLDLIKRKRMLDTVTVLSAFIDLDRNYVFLQLVQGPERSLLLLLRSLELCWPAVDRFLDLRRSKRNTWDLDDFAARNSGKEALRREYDAMDIATAQRVVRFMKVRRAATSQPAALAS